MKRARDGVENTLAVIIARGETSVYQITQTVQPNVEILPVMHSSGALIALADCACKLCCLDPHLPRAVCVDLETLPPI
jgi:hypothetical protein